MSVKDIRSNLQVTAANVALITGNGTTNGASIDTAAFELGTMFNTSLGNFTDGTYNFALEESDTGAFGGEEVAIVDGSPKLIGTLAGLVLTAATANSGVLPSLGVISNLRFLRMNVVATSVSTGADAFVMVTEKGEEMPVI